MATILTHVRDYLVAQSVVRRERETTPVGKPPLWLRPRYGVPAPGEGDHPTQVGAPAVLGAFKVGELPAVQDWDGYRQRDIIEFRIRVTDATLAEDLAKELTDQFAPSPRGRRVNYELVSGVHVYMSRKFNGHAELGADDESFDSRISFLFETRTNP